MSDFSKDADEFVCAICKKTYRATSERKFCDDCARIIYKNKQGKLFERDCENCKHHSEGGCSKWNCEFERR